MLLLSPATEEEKNNAHTNSRADTIGSGGSSTALAAASSTGTAGTTSSGMTAAAILEMSEKGRKRKSSNVANTKFGKSNSAPSLFALSAEDMQTQVKSIKQSSDAFARSFKEFKDDSVRVIHMRGKQHIFSFYDGAQVSVAFYTQLGDDILLRTLQQQQQQQTVDHFLDLQSRDKQMQQIVEELKVLLQNVLHGTHGGK